MRISNYLNGFTPSSPPTPAFATGRSDYKLVLGLSEQPPLTVWIYRDREQFVEHAMAAIVPEWAAGFWSPRLGRASFT